MFTSMITVKNLGIEVASYQGSTLLRRRVFRVMLFAFVRTVSLYSTVAATCE